MDRGTVFAHHFVSIGRVVERVLRKSVVSKRRGNGQRGMRFRNERNESTRRLTVL